MVPGQDDGAAFQNISGKQSRIADTSRRPGIYYRERDHGSWFNRNVDTTLYHYPCRTIAGLFAIMNYGLESWSSLGLLVLSIFFLYTAVRMVHQDIKKAIIEFTPDTITVRWPLSKPVIIVKEAITAIEVRKNIHHSHRWLSRSAIMIFFVGVIPTILFSGQSQYISRVISRVSYTVFVVYYLAVTMFFGLLFYHGYIRSRYTQMLAISTNNKKIVGLYVDDPGRMSEMLSKWRVGAV